MAVVDAGKLSASDALKRELCMMTSTEEQRRWQAGEDSTADHGVEPAARALAPMPNLTILAHPEAERVGARVSLVDVVSGRKLGLSRTAPRFAQPGASEAMPLADRGVSRTPIWLVAGDSPGSLRLLRGDSTMSVLVGGAPLREHREISAEQLEEGTVVLVAERVALVLHHADAVPDWAGGRHGMVGESQRMLRLQRGIRQVAALEGPVLLRGESGSGKELVARAIHEASGRRGKPYVVVNVAAIPTALAAAELFGAARGAFTGADADRPGYFSRADGGTLFLDEIGEATPEVQALLLRALESGEVQTVGSLPPRRVDVRVIAATDADLQSRMAAERFRAPLFHRLASSSLQVPALRTRREDFGRLLYGFLRTELAAAGASERLEARSSSGRPWLPAAVVAHLAALSWPGNVRQLRNCARAMVAGARDAEEVTLGDLEELLAGAAPALDGARAALDGERAAGTVALDALRSTRSAVSSRSMVSTLPTPSGRGYRAAVEVTEDELLAALRKHRWRLTPTAGELGIARTSLYALIDRCPRVRKAGDLELGEIERELARAGGDVDAAVDLLGVSRHGLLLRLRELRAASPGERRRES